MISVISSDDTDGVQVGNDQRANDRGITVTAYFIEPKILDIILYYLMERRKYCQETKHV